MAMYASAALLAVLFSTPPGQGEKEILFSGTGSHSRPVTTRSKVAQRYFDQGLNFMYAFNHSEAIRSFEAAARHDPGCGMAWWGVAFANGPHINNTYVAPEQLMAARSALTKAQTLAPKLKPVEKDLIHALRARNFGSEDRATLDQSFATAMRQVWKKHPKDADVGALFAEAMMNLRPWDLWLADGKPQPGTTEITQTLAQVLKINPNHPLGLHLTIHAWEASPTPEKAGPSAERLRNLQPGLGHNVHMPSHIDVRLGNWQKAIVSNEKAIQADSKYRSKRPRQGFYRLYMAHNRHMLGFAAMMVGQGGKSIKAMDELAAGIPKDFLQENAMFMDGFMAMPLEARVRFGRWDEILSYPELPDYLPLSRALRHVARGVAYAAKGMVREAESEQMLFRDAKERVPEGVAVGNNPAKMVLAVAEPVLEGEILLAKDRNDEAVAALKSSVQAEDQLRYDEPPDWILPTRHILGVALLKAGRDKEAENVYREDLRRLPNNGWSLNGLAEALARQGKTKEAAQMRAKFTQIWKGADTPIQSSCLCVPKP